MRLRLFFGLLAAFILGVSGALAQGIGFQVNGQCSAGACPPMPLAYNSNGNTPVSTTVTLGDGDIYDITGSLTTTNDASGGHITLNYGFIVEYRGNGSNTPSQDDSLRIDMLTSYQTTFGTGNFGAALMGTFGPTVASSSNVEECVNGSCAFANPPGNFSNSIPFSQGPSGGAFSFDYANTAHFGAGSPVNSYIEFYFPGLSQPVITSVISASAYGGFGAVAPGDWMEIYGANLGLATRGWGAKDFINGTAPTALAGTTVRIGAQLAYVDYVSPTQVDALVPSTVPMSGPQEVVVTTAGGASIGFPITVNQTEAGLLAPASFNIGGTPYVVALYPDGKTYVLPPGSISGVPSQRAKPGDTIVLYGVGFGQVNPDVPVGQLSQGENKLVQTFAISIGGVPATVSYQGLAPGYVGLYQFNVTVPNVPAGDQVPVTYSLGGVKATQPLDIAIGS